MTGVQSSASKTTQELLGRSWPDFDAKSITAMPSMEGHMEEPSSRCAENLRSTPNSLQASPVWKNVAGRTSASTDLNGIKANVGMSSEKDTQERADVLSELPTILPKKTRSPPETVYTDGEFAFDNNDVIYQ